MMINNWVERARDPRARALSLTADPSREEIIHTKARALHLPLRRTCHARAAIVRPNGRASAFYRFREQTNILTSVRWWRRRLAGKKHSSQSGGSLSLQGTGARQSAARSWSPAANHEADMEMSHEEQKTQATPEPAHRHQNSAGSKNRKAQNVLLGFRRTGTRTGRFWFGPEGRSSVYLQTPGMIRSEKREKMWKIPLK